MESLFHMVEEGQVFHAGTFNGNPIAMAAARATLEILLDPSEDVYGRMRRLGLRLFEGLRSLSERTGVPMLVQGVPTCFHLFLTPQKAIRDYRDFIACDMSRTQAWVEQLLAEGILQMSDRRWYVSAAHSEQDISATLEKADRVLARLAPSWK